MMSEKYMKRKVKRVVLSVFKKPLNLGLFILFVSTSVLLLKVALMQWDKKSNADTYSRTLEEDETSESAVPEEIRDWEYFIHPEYRFSIYVPRLLVKREYDDSGDYLFFVRFEENRFSEDSGVAIGVSNRALEEEEAKTREIVEAEFSDIKPKREIVKLTDYDAIKLDYQGVDGVESRTIILVTNGDYTYSISTVPEQIDNVLAGFVMLE
jgi:hypothetical protein